MAIPSALARAVCSLPVIAAMRAAPLKRWAWHHLQRPDRCGSGGAVSGRGASAAILHFPHMSRSAANAISNRTRDRMPVAFDRK
jgi:hypothetical protein